MRRAIYILLFLLNIATTALLVLPLEKSVEASGRSWSETRYAGLFLYAWVTGSVGAETTIEWHLSPARCLPTFALVDLSWIAFYFFAPRLWRVPPRPL